MKKIVSLILITVIILFDRPANVFASAPIDPQYIFVRKDNTCSNCILWNGYWPENYNVAAYNEIVSKVGTKGTNQRKLGVGAIFFLQSIMPLEKNKASLRNLLTLSQSQDFPIYILLDGWGYLDGRPDLWNWWDANKPGYNPDNKNNVEWTCWDSSCAIKKSWRNWGSEFQVGPQPNLSSPVLIEATKAVLNELVPIVADWYKNLPAGQKYLLVGISLGGEVDIGANYYYYPNGINNGSGLAGSVQLGYAAVKMAGIKSSGQITSADLNEVVKRYLTELDKTAFDLGIPRNKIFNHVGGKGLAPFITYPPNVAFETSDASLNNYAQPGWSFYGDVTSQPQNYDALKNVLNQLGNGQWAVPEWLTWAGDYNGWVRALRNSLNYRNNRFINIANWEGVRSKQYVLDAIKTVVNEYPSCWVTTPYMDNVSVGGNTATLAWQKGNNNDAVYLNVSSKEGFTVAGTLSDVNVVNDVVTAKNSHTISSLSPGKYYWELIADGCGNQRKITDGSFEVAKPGDLNGDGKVDIGDFNKLTAEFGRPFTIFDFNLLVGNWGK